MQSVYINHMLPLQNHTHEAFCRAYIKTLSTKSAAPEAGISVPYANRLLKEPQIQERIERLMADRNKRCEVGADYVLREAKSQYEMLKEDMPKVAHGYLDMLAKHSEVQAYAPRIKAEVPSTATLTQRADRVATMMLSGGVTLEAGNKMLDALTKCANIEQATEIKARLAAIEQQLQGGECGD